MRFLPLILLAFCFLSPFTWSLVPLPTCEDRYNSCMWNCCASCGANVSIVGNGLPTCSNDAGNPNQACINACLPCANQYQGCMKNESGGGAGQTAGTGNYSCCYSMALLFGVVGATAFHQRRIG